MGMVDSQPCSAGNQAGLYGKELELMSFGVRQLEGDII